MFTSNGQSVYLGQQVKTGMQAACEPSIIKRIDTENEAVFVVQKLFTGSEVRDEAGPYKPLII